MSHNKAFLAAYDAYADAIYRHCYFRVFQKARAEELVQETFMKAWEYMQNDTEVKNMRAFLYRIATNLIIDESRKKKEESLDALLEELPHAEPASVAHKELLRDAHLKEIRRKLAELSPEDARLITFRYFDDLDPKDIAHITGERPGTISVKINRAVAKLKKAYDGHF